MSNKVFRVSFLTLACVNVQRPHQVGSGRVRRRITDIRIEASRVLLTRGSTMTHVSYWETPVCRNHATAHNGTTAPLCAVVRRCVVSTDPGNPYGLLERDLARPLQSRAVSDTQPV